jgi:hypothetical protein
MFCRSSFNSFLLQSAKKRFSNSTPTVSSAAQVIPSKNKRIIPHTLHPKNQQHNDLYNLTYYLPKLEIVF